MRSTVVYLHIGLMKTGTTYLQRTLREATAQLEAEGVAHYPDNQVASHRMSKALRGVAINGSHDHEGAVALDRLPRFLARTPARAVLISEEALSFCDEDEVRRLGALLDGYETHVVITARNLAKTIPSMWQERVKSGRVLGFDKYCDAVVEGEAGPARTFWRRQDVPAVAARWETIVPAERIHVVTVPAVSTDRRLLLTRFCSVLGLDPAVVPDATSRANESLGHAQTELLRRVNAQLGSTFENDVLRGNIVKRMFAETLLSGQGGSAPSVPETYREFCAEQTDRMVTEIDARGYRVVGDLADLASPESAFVPENALRPDDVIVAAARAIADLLEREVDRG